MVARAPVLYTALVRLDHPSLLHLLAFLAALLLTGCPQPPPECVPTEEQCNGLDDDCDGRIDNAPGGGPLRRDCSNACGPGTEECHDGEWHYCTAPQPSEEVCDGIDNNCDGRIDEVCECVHGQTRQCGTDVGECEFGVQHCNNGYWGDCILSYDPADHPEICDGLDNNCNGVVDEGCSCEPGQTQPCGTDVGECRAGVQTCTAGGSWGPACEGVVGPRPEACDGLDNNCDGEADYIVSIDFGWEADRHEPNDTCGDGSPIYNSSGQAQVLEGAGWVSPSVTDPRDLNTYPTLYPGGDEDWYYSRAVEGGHTCWPWSSQCSFVLRAQLSLLDREFVEGSDQDPSDYQLCVYTSTCSTVTEPTTRFCTQGTNWVERDAAYLMTIVWRGTCGSDDSKDIKVQVRSPTGRGCGHYQVYLRFDYDDTVPCP